MSPFMTVYKTKTQITTKELCHRKLNCCGSSGSGQMCLFQLELTAVIISIYHLYSSLSLLQNDTLHSECFKYVNTFPNLPCAETNQVKILAVKRG